MFVKRLQIQERKQISAEPMSAEEIRQLAEAAKLTGLHTLDELASALGIPRSTAWTIRNGGHKASGVSVSIINRYARRACERIGNSPPHRLDHPHRRSQSLWALRVDHQSLRSTSLRAHWAFPAAPLGPSAT